MTRTIFRNTFLVGLSVLFLCAVLFFGLQYTQAMDETKAALGQDAVYAEKGLELGGTDYLSILGDVNRVTWIDAEGNVLYDSEYPLPLPSQLQYPEIESAFKTGEGSSVRKSDESGESCVCYALKCKDGTVLALSKPVPDVQYALLAVSPVLWVLILVLLISGVLAFRAAQQIVKPINEMDLEHPSKAAYPELSPFLDKIQEQRLTIQEEVSQREDMRREFSANVSHELKTPLTSISGFAELMSQGMVSPDRVQEFGQDIYKESQRLMALIDDILKLSRLDETEDMPHPTEPIDLYSLTEEVTKTLKHNADQQNISLVLSGEPVMVQGIPSLLREMVYNLCDNAIKYNVPGGRVEISITSAPPRFVIKDTGIGIPEDQQKRVFERFYRVDKSHSKDIGGTGLGLSIVKHGAMLHNAKLELNSELGNGTEITLTFPDQNTAASSET